MWNPNESDQPDVPALKALGAGVVACTAGDFDLGVEHFKTAYGAAADGACVRVVCQQHDLRSIRS